MPAPTELAPHEQETVGEIWLARAHAELATASVFEHVARATPRARCARDGLCPGRTGSAR